MKSKAFLLILILVSLFQVVISCSGGNSKPGIGYGSDKEQQPGKKILPKDTLLQYIKAIGELANSGQGTLNEYKAILHRNTEYKVAVDSSTGDSLDRDIVCFYFDKDSDGLDSERVFLHIVNIAPNVAVENNYISLQDFENNFGPGKIISWQNKLGVPAPKEYNSPVQYTIGKRIFVQVIANRPDDKMDMGILYIDMIQHKSDEYSVDVV